MRVLAVGTLMFVCGLIGGILVPKVISQGLGYHPELAPYFIDRLALLQELPQYGPSIAMVGDSITQRGMWNELGFPPSIVANRGLEGATVDQIADLVAPTIPATAQRLYVMAGINDLNGAKREADQVVKSYSRLLSIIGGRGRTIVVQSTLLTSRTDLNVKVETLNKGLRELCLANKCEWLDVNAVVSAEGRLLPQFTTDGIHLNGAGYFAWMSLLVPMS